jgi:hypothetical protein
VGSLYYIRWPSLFLEFLQQWFPGFVEVESQTPSYFIDLPLKMEPIQCSETSDISTQTPGKHPKVNILHLTHGESLKSRVTQYTTPRCGPSDAVGVAVRMC